MVMGSLTQKTQIAIIGAGPGGYVAALRAADLGLEVVLVDERPEPGGVCLLEGCIPSKTLINAVELVQSAREGRHMGLRFENLDVDPEKLRKFRDRTVRTLSKGVRGLLKKRGVELLQGRARFTGPHTLAIEGGDVAELEFEYAIVATGSRPRTLPAAEGLPVWNSRDALEIPNVPERLVVVGGGYIGLELGLVYAGLSSWVSLVEFHPRMLQGADPDLVDVMVKSSKDRFDQVLVESEVVDIRHREDTFEVDVRHEGEVRTLEADQVLVSVGRIPNTEDLGLAEAGLTPEQDGTLAVNEENRTAVPHIFAIGDITPGPMLAHKASREAKVAAEVIADHHSAFDNRAIPAVVFTDPEIAWTGLTEEQARNQERPHTVGRFPLRALGRARTLGRTDGMAKVISDPDTGLLLGVGMVGPNASELISEGTLALEMGATLEDILVTIHPHPTLSEAILEAAEMAAGAPIHMPPG